MWILFLVLIVLVVLTLGTFTFLVWYGGRVIRHLEGEDVND